MSVSFDSHMQMLAEKSKLTGIDYKTKYADALVDLHQDGGNRFSIITIIRFSIALITIIFAALIIDVNQPQDVIIEGKRMAGGTVIPLQSRGFAIPFLLAAIGIVLWDLYKMGKTVYTIRNHPDAEVIFKDQSLRHINANFERIVQPVIAEHHLEALADSGNPLNFFVHANNKHLLYKAFKRSDKPKDTIAQALKIKVAAMRDLAGPSESEPLIQSDSNEFSDMQAEIQSKALQQKAVASAMRSAILPLGGNVKDEQL